MSYSSFTNLEIKRTFGVEQIIRSGIFDDVPPRSVSDWLRQTLTLNSEFALAQGTEKARSEFIIAPIFAELKHQAEDKISVFSGIEFNVDKKKRLAGFCDFLVSRSPYQTALESPVIVAVEAKRQDIERGIVQCIAEMIAARIYNAKQGKDVSVIYGCVTSGNAWQFLRLEENQALVDITVFDVRQDLEKIFGILYMMALG